MYKPYMLMILDGYGIAPPGKFNAIDQAKKPVMDKLLSIYSHTKIYAHGLNVGLPDGVMGNSEVGHLNIGAGRIVWQEITRIDKAIERDGLISNQALVNAINHAKENKRKLHLYGLISDGYVHSSDKHYYAILRLAKKLGVSEDKVFLHCFLDGRDTPPKSGNEYVNRVYKMIQDEKIGRIGVIVGRYYAMDRDKRWERVKLAYDSLTKGEGVKVKSPIDAVKGAYDRGETDEFVKPIVVVDDNEKPIGTIGDGDSIIFFNFRSDRAREITHSFLDNDFSGFKRDVHPKVYYTCFTEYEATIQAPVAFPPQKMTNIFGEVISKKGWNQLRIAETEKYAHVTFFFNGGVEKPFENEERVLISSPKVATYDLKPEMSAYEVCETVLKEIDKQKYQIIVLNFANSDMVGHTGVLEAAIKAIEAVDECMGKVIDKILLYNGTVLVTADHGNAEQMWDFKTNSPHTAHTTNMVPFIVISNELKNVKLREGSKLCDIAPTFLKLWGWNQPEEMDGESTII